MAGLFGLKEPILKTFLRIFSKGFFIEKTSLFCPLRGSLQIFETALARI